MSNLKRHFERLEKVDNTIEWQKSVIRTVQESDYYNKRPHEQVAEIGLANHRLKEARRHKDEVLNSVIAALSKEQRANLKELA